MYNTPRPSSNPKKKYEVDVKIGDKVKRIQFGARGYEHYTEGHLDEKRRENYVKRHKAMEDWNNPFTAGWWSYHYLWRYKRYREAIGRIREIIKEKQGK